MTVRKNGKESFGSEKLSTRYRPGYFLPYYGDLPLFFMFLRKHKDAYFSGFRHLNMASPCPEKEVIRIIKEFKTPWLSLNDSKLSLAVFLNFLSIGNNLRNNNPFDFKPVKDYRSQLGDWREPISASDWKLIKSHRRNKFYELQGFSQHFLELDEEVYQELVDVNEIGHAYPAREQRLYDQHQDKDSFLDVLNHMYCSHLYSLQDRFYHFENHVRYFIENRLLASIGPNWIEQLPDEIRQRWSKKKKQQTNTGEPERSLIEFLDFMDYPKVIAHEVYWNEVFSVIFNRKNFVFELFQRLYPAYRATRPKFISLVEKRHESGTYIISPEKVMRTDDFIFMVETTRFDRATRHFLQST